MGASPQTLIPQNSLPSVYISRIAIQIGAAAVPPTALLAAVHGIALAVRAGASGRVYRWAVSAVAVIGVGAFVVSFLALRDLMQVIGYSYATAWIFPAIIDSAVAVSTLMLVALEDKPARRARTVTAPIAAQVEAGGPPAPAPVQNALRATFAPDQHADAGDDHTALAEALVDAGATTKPAAVVALILSAHAEGTALNRIASDMGIHHKTVSKIIGGTLSRCDGHRATKDDPRNPPRARPLGLRDD